MKNMLSFFIFITMLALPLHLAKASNTDIVQSAIDQGIAAAHSGATAETYKEIFANYFNVNIIAERALGATKRRLTPNQITEYNTIFADYIVYTQLNKFKGYGGGKIIITGETSNIVNSKLTEKELKINWQLENEKIVDVNVNGISMMQVYRADIASIAKNQGGDGLLTAMQQKINNLK